MGGSIINVRRISGAMYVRYPLGTQANPSLRIQWKHEKNISFFCLINKRQQHLMEIKNSTLYWILEKNDKEKHTLEINCYSN